MNFTALSRMSPSILSPQSLGNPTEEEAEGVWEPEWMEDIRKTRPVESTDQDSCEISDTQEVKYRTAMGLFWILCVPTLAFTFIILWGFWVCEQGSLWFFCLFLEIFCFSWVAWSRLDVLHYIIFWYAWVLSLGSLFFSNDRQKESGCRWQVRWEHLGESMEGNCHQGILYEKRTSF